MSHLQATIHVVCQFLIPAATVLAFAVLPGSDAGSVVTINEIVSAGVAAVLTAGAAARPAHLGANAACGDRSGTGHTF